MKSLTKIIFVLALLLLGPVAFALEPVSSLKLPPPTKSATPLALVGDACTTDLGFASIFYDNPDWTDVSAAKFLNNIQSTWGSLSPFPGAIEADGKWSAKYKADFFAVGDFVNGANLHVYTTFQGYAEVKINSSIVFSGTNTGAPREFPPTLFPTLAPNTRHTVEVKYANNSNPQATLELRALSCDALNPTVCVPKTLFFTSLDSGPSRPEQLYFTKKPVDTSVGAGLTKYADFLIDYVNSGPAATVQWQRKPSPHVGTGPFANVGSNIKTHRQGPPLSYNTDDETYFRAQLSNGLCQFVDKIKEAKLTVTPATTYPELKCSPTTQSTRVNTKVTIFAEGGDGKYDWSAPGGIPSGATGGSNFVTEYPSAGTKTVTLGSGDGQSKTCSVAVDVPPPVTSKPVCSGPAQLEIEETGNFTVTDGTAPYTWSTASVTWDPWSGVGDKFSTMPTEGTLRGTNVVKVADSKGEQSECIVQVVDKPTNPEPVKCSPKEYESVTQPNEAVFKASGGDPGSYSWKTDCSRRSEGCPGIGYEAEYKPRFLEKITQPQTYTVTISDKSSKDECKVTVNPGPVDPDSESTCLTGECKGDPTDLFAYDLSPIGSFDCAQEVEKYPALGFPLVCDPHSITDPPPITAGSVYLNYRYEGEARLGGVGVYGNSTIVSRREASPPERAIFIYPSIFDENNQLDSKNMVKVGQVNAYNKFMSVLKEFANNIWIGGAEPLDPYKPKGLPMKYVNIAVGPTEYWRENGTDQTTLYVPQIPQYEWNKPDVISGDVRNWIYLSNPNSALDTEVVERLTYQYLIHNRIEGTKLGLAMFSGTKHPEAAALKEGLSMYFAGRKMGGNYTEHYYRKARGSSKDRLEIIDTPKKDYTFKASQLDIVEGTGPGQQLARTLLILRNDINDKEKLDKVVMLALGILANSYNSAQSNQASLIQQYYIELQRTIGRFVKYGQLTQDVADKFLKVVRSEANMGSTIGNIVPVDINQIYVFKQCLPVLGARYEVNLPPFNTVEPGKIKSITFVGEHFGPLDFYVEGKHFEQKSMNSPVSGFRAIVRFTGEKEITDKIHASITSHNFTDRKDYVTVVDIPGTLTIPACNLF